MTQNRPRGFARFPRIGGSMTPRSRKRPRLEGPRQPTSGRRGTKAPSSRCSPAYAAEGGTKKMETAAAASAMQSTVSRKKNRCARPSKKRMVFIMLDQFLLQRAIWDSRLIETGTSSAMETGRPRKENGSIRDGACLADVMGNGYYGPSFFALEFSEKVDELRLRRGVLRLKGLVHERVAERKRQTRARWETR